MTQMRIQKYLSEQGIASRRTTAEWLEKGYIKLNGQVLSAAGSLFDPDKDKLEIEPKAYSQKKHYYLFNKPKGIVTVNAQAGETEIKDIVHLPKGVVPVGRLDKETGGLIFLTNDGVVARRIMDPAFEHEKEYEVSLYKAISDPAIRELETGVILFGQRTKPAVVKRLGGYKISITIREGKNRQIRRMCEMVCSPVKMLIRRRIMNFNLGKLPPGALKELSKVEQDTLFIELGLSPHA